MKLPRNTALFIVSAIGILFLSISVYLFCDAFRVYRDQKQCVKKEELNKLLDARLKELQLDESPVITGPNRRP